MRFLFFILLMALFAGPVENPPVTETSVAVTEYTGASVTPAKTVGATVTLTESAEPVSTPENTKSAIYPDMLSRIHMVMRQIRDICGDAE